MTVAALGIRPARVSDADPVAGIYNQGIEERQATFETRLNSGSMDLLRRCGFREVGVHQRHGRLDGRWRDVLVVERLLGQAAEEPFD